MPDGVYGVRAGVALGLDAGAGGAVWGYSMAKRHVLWTAKALPWPHYFAEDGGVGGSVDAASGTVLLVTCQATGQAVRGTVIGGSGKTCLKPRLVAIGPWGARTEAGFGAIVVAASCPARSLDRAQCASSACSSADRATAF